ncbi:hypothetical protein N7452_005741 [Penicillium brevicompactum]|uniref:Uncharacterized protein n=1 Tax=Penicillium brevicompactum TaxID=5074 RepID=A0A9W9QJ99_PENBR|nr:hypothetical protein N7452_005741 [Penicillium brevicompactum]
MHQVQAINPKMKKAKSVVYTGAIGHIKRMGIKFAIAIAGATESNTRTMKCKTSHNRMQVENE